MNQNSDLLAILDQAYDHRSWHGTNLRGSIRGVPIELANWRPAPHRHNIREIVVHAAYWKCVVWRRLAGEARGSFPLKGSNWFVRPADDAPPWKADVALLHDMHRSLRGSVERFPGRRWHQRLPKSRDSAFTLVAGAAAHDLYHAGQIQLLKRIAALTAEG